MSQLKKFGRMFGLMFVTAGATAFLLYFGMKALNGRTPIAIYVLFVHFAPYHELYPIPYLLIIVLVFAIVGALWLIFIALRFIRFRFLQIIVLPWMAVLLASPVCGMLWVYHDMQAGFFPAFPQMIDYLLFGAQQGVLFALNVVLFSMPLNLLAYGVACLLLVMFAKRFGFEQPEHAQMGSA
ncbi:hypothetical protein TFLX_01279 [Thermoflexales bacterium]|nr:hypothetical protein TFLX_01279 [Thermoflexales bacterium]